MLLVCSGDAGGRGKRGGDGVDGAAVVGNGAALA